MTNKPEQLTDLRALILCEIGDFFAGFGCPGEPETPEDMQRELTMRVGRILNDHIVNYPRCEALVEILRECRIARDKAQEELQERRDYPEDVNSKQAFKIGIYERIYGLLRECPGAGSIYSVAPIEGECIPHGVLAHIGCISFYCNLGHLHIAEPAAFTGCHTHSLNGGTND
ncbi:TPA: hypothetical protein R8G59_002681 [Citrobacter freundii]|uniref:hypothetical protein n=1 Tax=Citrobacter freundii TaxID=546 RepID=UPI001BCF4128|nr:hypothetical protein [Citrobacter freundii]EDV1048309.1 hypothetical protein [Salmonella enterica subsp. enterica]HEE9955196.1 hypothetical protein [Citrobacter freundii]